MQVSVTFRHVDPTDALRTHAEEKLVRLKKYLHRPVEAHVILSVSKDRHVAEIALQADHESLFAKEVTADLYSAIDLAVTKLEHQAQRLKQKRETHKGLGPGRHVEESTSPDTIAPRLVATTVSAKPIPVEEAVDRLMRSGDEFLAFVDSATQSLAVIYRRKDGNYGLIESPR
jgi:putative sigma-54 modulation protein